MFQCEEHTAWVSSTKSLGAHSQRVSMDAPPLYAAPNHLVRKSSGSRV
jgi:hypothetical protein